jgi:hypothetical protein
MYFTFFRERLMKSFAMASLLLIAATRAVAQGTAYKNPVDGKAYVAPNGWVTYKPEGGVPERHERVRILNVRLLQDQEEMATRVAPEDLADYVKLANEVAVQVFSSYDKRVVLQTVFTCRPGRCEKKIASSGGPPDDLLQSYYDKLVKLPPPKISDEISFQVTTGVNY